MSMDRGYLDFERIYSITLDKAFFVTRAKRNMAFKRTCPLPCGKSAGIRCDQTIRLKSHYPSKYYPKKLRRIKYYDTEREKILVFLTNNFDLKALEIAQLYKHRWQIETFFKWIKQHLKIKSFWGHSANAVKTQVWTAIAVYAIVAIVKKRLDLPQTMYEILQILSITIFEKTTANQLFKKDHLQNFKE
ncbi:IS4 family transposase [Galbibacter sp. EGI 63066]|uniref:IS4 family transposase n=1 Tax=Galbibacter sp. EGI 63066 TaxID=2993559 RepID=UPI0022488428|nr:IS4 family transposase [Galbibacter sp. EGI 63066]